MNAKVFELKKGKGKNATIVRVEVKTEDDIKTLGMCLYYGWSAKEVKGATVWSY